MAEYRQVNQTNLQAGQPERPLLVVGLTAGTFNFKIIAGTVEIASELIGVAPYVQAAGVATTGLTLGAIYDIPECRPIIRDVLVGAFCFVTPNAQEIERITSGCICFNLCCFTKKSFREILSDFKLGKIAKRLKDKFSKAGINTTGLELMIENMEKVEETNAAIEQEYDK